MRTVQGLINAAYARQKQAQQGIDASQEGELMPQLYNILGIFFGIGARVNPEFFSVEEAVPWSTDMSGWPRPVAAELVYDVMTAGGAEVARVPRNDLGAEPGMPSVYRMGQVYYPASAAPAANDAITFIYAKRPDEPATLTATIDTMWPAGHESLLALELAIYIATKDRRFDDADRLSGERDRQLMRFLAFLEHEDIGERRRKGNSRKFAGSSIVPIASLLSGKSSVEIT